MNVIGGILQKPLAAMTVEELVVVALVLLVCVCVVGIALSSVLQVSRRTESESRPRSLRRTISGLQSFDKLNEERVSHTD